MRIFLFFLLMGMIGCQQSGGGLYCDLGECIQVAKQKHTDNHQVIVCDLSLMKDTIVLPLSYLTETMCIVKMDDRAGMLLPGTNVTIGNDHILVAGSYLFGKIPHKLFDKSGKFIVDIGAFGRGPGEYQREIFHQQLDEKNNRIYLLPWDSNRILVYDLKGNPLDPIRLPTIIHIGIFRVNFVDSIVSIIVAPVSDRRISAPPTTHFAWSQDLSGRLIKGLSLSPKYLPIFDMSRFDANYINSFGNTKAQDIYFSTWFNLRQDTLYHYDIQTNQLTPQFTIEKKKKNLINNFCELPNHYLGNTSELREAMPPGLDVFNCKYFLVEKTSLKGSYIKLENDFLCNMVVNQPAYFFHDGYFVVNYEPIQLLEELENTLANKKMTSEMREKLIELKSSIKETDNNYILYAKLKQ